MGSMIGSHMDSLDWVLWILFIYFNPSWATCAHCEFALPNYLGPLSGYDVGKMMCLLDSVFAVQLFYLGKIWTLSKFWDLQLLVAEASEFVSFLSDLFLIYSVLSVSSFLFSLGFCPLLVCYDFPHIYLFLLDLVFTAHFLPVGKVYIPVNCS